MNKIMHTTEYENIYFDFENVKHPEIKFYADDSHPYVRELENLNRSLAKSSGNHLYHQIKLGLERLKKKYKLREVIVKEYHNGIKRIALVDPNGVCVNDYHGV